MRSLWVLALCVSAFVLSGCVDESGAPASESTPEDAVLQVDPETGDERLLRRVPVRFDDRAPTFEERSFPGTFELTQHGYPAGDVQRMAGLDPGNHHRYDITDLVPLGVPVRLVAEVDASLGEGDLDIWIDLPPEAIWTGQFDTPYGGFSRVSYVVLLEEATEVHANVRYDEVDDSQSFDYVLDVAVASAPHSVVGGVPVSVPVPRDASSMELTFFDEAPERVWLWDEDDRLVATDPPTDGAWNHTFEGDGAYVLMLPEGPAQANVTLLVPHDGATAPRPLAFGRLKQEFTQTDPVRFQADTAAETTFDLDRVPLQVGVQVDLERFTKDLSATLDGPDGALLRVAITDDVPFVSTSAEGGFGFTFLTDLGVPGLAAGTYTATFSGDPNGPGELSAWVVHYARS